jgi:hypothetical protein
VQIFGADSIHQDIVDGVEVEAFFNLGVRREDNVGPAREEEDSV